MAELRQIRYMSPKGLPKGAVYLPGSLGSVQELKGRYRMRLARMPDLGAPWTYGPGRATEAEANQDLARARQSVTRQDMLEFARALRGAPAATSAGRAS